MEKNLQIAVASGKGGTGKTTISVSLALSLADERDVWFMDCDVEAPNAHIFLKPEFERQIDAAIQIPQIDANLCSLCGKCVEVCQFHALAKIGTSVLVFPQLCHGCGSCTWNCPEHAIQEIPNKIGVLESGMTNEGIHFARGLLTVSEPMPTPVIRKLKRMDQPPGDAIVILDSPPGASCSVVETLRGVDFVLLVTEPTPFGLHDLKQMLGILEDMNIPAGIVINRDGIGDNSMELFLDEKKIPIMMRVPYDKALAEGIAAGKSLIEIHPQYRTQLQSVFQQIDERVKGIRI